MYVVSALVILVYLTGTYHSLILGIQFKSGVLSGLDNLHFILLNIVILNYLKRDCSTQQINNSQSDIFQNSIILSIYVYMSDDLYAPDGNGLIHLHC